MSSMTIILTPAATRPRSAGGANSRRPSNRRKSAAGVRNRSRPASASRQCCKSAPSPARACPEPREISIHKGGDAPPSTQTPSDKVLPVPSIRSANTLGSPVAAALAWDGEQDMKVNLAPAYVTPAARGAHKGCSRPPSAASALSHQSRRSVSRGSTQGSARIARYRCLTERPQLGDNEPQFRQVWDLTCDNVPSYMRQTRTSQISRGHSLAAFYNLRLLREKHNLLCGGGRCRTRSCTPASAPKTDSILEDLEVLSADGGDAREPVSSMPESASMHPYSIFVEGACLDAQRTPRSDCSDGTQEDEASTTSLLTDSWNLRPSIASWLLKPTPNQRLAAAKTTELPAVVSAGPTHDGTPRGQNVERLNWLMHPSVGTWFMMLLPSKSKKEVHSEPCCASTSYVPFTSLPLRPLPAWFHLPPHPPVRSQGSTKLGPPPFPTCTKYKYARLEEPIPRQADYKDKQCQKLQLRFAKSSSGLLRRSDKRHGGSHMLSRRLPVSSPSNKRRLHEQDGPLPCNASNPVLFDTWCSKLDATGRPLPAGSGTRWHDVALTLVAQQQNLASAHSIAPPGAGCRFDCRPSVGTWLCKPTPGPAQIKALANMSTSLSAAMTVKRHGLVNKPGCLALHYAARDGNPSAVRMLLAASAEPGAADERGISPLHLAAEAGHDEIVRLLLDAHASPHCATSGCSSGKRGITALHAAACGGHVNVAMRLLTAGLSPVQARGDGVLPLHFAAQGGHLGVTLVLLAAGSPVDQCGAGGFTPLHDSALGGHVDIVAALLAARANPDVATLGGTTPLHGAAQRGHADVTKCLLLNGAAPNLDSVGGFTALHDAAHAGHKAVVRQLIRAKISPNIRSAEGATPLHLAAQAGWTGIAAFLVKAREAFIDESPNPSSVVASPRRLAASRGHISVIRALRAGRCGRGTPY